MFVYKLNGCGFESLRVRFNPLPINFNKIDRFIKTHDKIRYLVLTGYSYFDKTCDKIRNLISEKSGIKDSVNHNFRRKRIDL